MNDEPATNRELPAVGELLTLEDGVGEGLHVRAGALAEFEAAVAVSLEELVARWAAFASPRDQGRSRALWRR